MEQLGKYKIESKLGEGAMGFVYKAWHPGFNDYVALKTIQDTRLEGRELLERFKLEGQALAKLKHQNIVQIYDADQANGVHFIVMEYINGGGLDRLIARRDGTVPLAKRVSYIVPVCYALEYAHKRRLYHRDIKPANIMLQIDGLDEIVKVVDFGIARLVDFSHTQTKLLIGSPAYMAPELVTASAKANEKTDIWALGVTLYELISYQRPFAGKSFEELRQNIVHGHPKPLTQIVPDCPRDLASVVEKSLAKDSSSRYQTVEDLLLDLEPIAKRLRTDVAGTLVRRAKDLLEIGEFESAKPLLNEARKYDATNLQVRSLLHKVDEELRRKELLPRLQEDLRAGRNFLGLGQYLEAKAAAEHALGLDSRFEPAQKLLAEIQEAEALTEEIQQKLSYAKRYILEGELTEASRTVEEVLALDADNQEAVDLRAKIRSRREELERRKKLNQFLRSTEDLLIVGKYEECLSLLNQALKDFPENRELQKRKESALSEKTEQIRQSHLNKAKKLRTSQQFDQALEILDELLTKFPGDSAGVSLRSSIQKEREQEHLSKELGLAWEELRSLKHQGEFSEALDLSKELVVKFPSEGRIKEFVRELEDEIRLEQVHTQLDATVNKIRELIRDGRFSQALLASKDALRSFQDNPQLVALHNEAISQQDRKDALEKQNLCALRVRERISAGQFKAAAEMARKALTELGEHSGLREAMGNAERLYAAQIEKSRQQELIATEIQASCEKGDIGAATRILQKARNEGLIGDNTPLERTLLENIDRAKDEEQKQREVQIELKRREVRQAVDQNEFSSAIRLANELERDFGLDREASDLRRKAESGLETEKIARDERDEVLQKVSELLNSGSIAAADLMLRNSLEAEILKKSDPRVVTLLGKTKELLDRDKERKKRVQQLAGDLRDLLRKGSFAPAIELGQRSLESEGHHVEIADLLKQAKIALAKEESLQRRRHAELQTIRALLEEGNTEQAKTVLDHAVTSRVLDKKDQEVTQLQRDIQELIARKAEPPPETKTVLEQPPELPPAPRKAPSKRWLLVGGAAGALAIVAGGSIYLIRGGTHPPPPPPIEDDQMFWEKAEDAMSRSPKDFKEALAEYEKIAELHGAHQTQAQPKMSEIKGLQNKEEKLFQQAHQALNKRPPDYAEAMGSFTEIVKMDGDRKVEAEEAFNRSDALSKGKDPRVLSEEGLKQGLAAFNRRDYVSAQRLFQETVRTVPSDWGRRHEAEGYLARSEHRVQQHESWVTADNAFRSKNYEVAKAAANRAASVGDGDEEDKNLSAALLKKIQPRIEQKTQYEDATKIETSDPKQAKTILQRVIDFRDGDPDVAASAKAEIGKIDAAHPPVDPRAERIHAIETELDQGNLAVAEENLKTLPSSDPDYQRLRGRLDDGTFDKNTAEAEDALKEKGDPSRRVTLQNLLTYFKKVAMQNNRHSPVANRYAQNLDAALNPTSDSGGSGGVGDKPGVGISAEDKSAIQIVLNRFSDAFNRRKAKDLREVWPRIPNSRIDAYQQFFDSHKVLRQTLTPKKWEPHGTGALVTCQQDLTFEQDGKQVSHPSPINFYMVKIQGVWKISDIPISADQ